MRLRDKVAVITGASRGIGRAIAMVYAREGARVVVISRDRARLEAIAAETDGLACVADMTKRAEVDAAIARAVERFGRIDILTQNVGSYPSMSLDDMTEEHWNDVYAVNVQSLLYVVKASLPHLKKLGGGGRITITSSITGPRVAYPNMTAHASSKAALTGFIRSAALELAPAGITVNGVEPGSVLTEGVREHLSDDDIAAMAATIPAKRLASAEDVAYAHLFLASSEAAYITGQTIVVDGGQTLPESPWAVP